MTLAKLPKLNKEYDHFDDGKIRESRKDTVRITEIIEYSNIDVKTLDQWEDEVIQCHWLYSSMTDYFIRGYLLETNENITYVRTIDGGWFSLGWWAGRLDIDGKLNEILNNIFK
jgi:hypothetical protein